MLLAALSRLSEGLILHYCLESKWKFSGFTKTNIHDKMTISLLKTLSDSFWNKVL
jgi:hypothetical protein